MKLAALFGSTLLVICMQMVSCSSMTPVYGAKAPASPADCPAHSYVASKRVGIYPETPSAHLYGSVESSEEHPTTDHYMPMGPCKDGQCAGKRLPVSICVQLPGAAPKKLSKNLLQQIICSLMHDPAAPASPAHYTPYEPQHKKPCEYPKKPCECSKKPYTPPKEPCDKPKETYEPVHKVYEPTPKPCAHEPTKKPYTPPCKPTYAPEKESYEPPKKPYTPHVPCKATYAPEKESPKKPYPVQKPTYGASVEMYESPKKSYAQQHEVYSPPKESYARVQYGAPKEPCATTPKPYYKPTTPAPCTTGHPTSYPAHPTPPAHPYTYPTAHPPTATYAPYTAAPRYPSMSYNAPSYPKPSAGSYESKAPVPTYPKTSKKTLVEGSLSIVRIQRPVLGSSCLLDRVPIAASAVLIVDERAQHSRHLIGSASTHRHWRRSLSSRRWSLIVRHNLAFRSVVSRAHVTVLVLSLAAAGRFATQHLDDALAGNAVVMALLHDHKSTVLTFALGRAHTVSSVRAGQPIVLANHGRYVLLRFRLCHIEVLVLEPVHGRARQQRDENCTQNNLHH
uniref:Uncharacterized protein n=1 Tax=Anopheles merus TaxID=30066 RepID=A0A182UTZ3_ANOME